jgi:hypothetical protein
MIMAVCSVVRLGSLGKTMTLAVPRIAEAELDCGGGAQTNFTT